MNEQNVLNGILIEETSTFTLHELSRVCGKPSEWIIALVNEGVIDPVGDEPSHWQFHAYCLRRVRIVQRLESDLGLNLQGAALAIDLLEELEELRKRLEVLESHHA